MPAGSTVSQPSTPEAATAFFGGLLPEGSGRSNLEALTDEQTTERLTLINDYALGAVGGGGSLAGYQPKTTLALLDGAWHAGVDGAASTHILKPVAAANEHALHAEAFCLELSRRIGYDRRMAGRSVERIHQEVGAPALGLPWDTDSKLEGVNPTANLKNLARLLRRRRDILGAGPDDRETLLAHMAFNTAVGNTDAHAHAQNFSTLRSVNGAVTLAPLYDVSTHALEQADASAVGEKVARYIGHGTRNLLNGKAAGIGGAHPSLAALGPVPGSRCVGR